ncbi:MAG: prepilin-type N-terminal cleavage/methylation domain-containing protein [Planctomycetes bacterium]|nr:prepilin-type N-terminal cleavage/methylation domain-containing protein [Planctomycetota bacterium]
MVNKRVQLFGGELRVRRGFTLVEILVVITIVAFLAGMSGGMFVRSYHKRVREKAATDLLHATMYARIVALERNLPCKLYLDEETQGFYLAIDVADEEGRLIGEQVIDNAYFSPVILPDEMIFESIAIKPAYALMQDMSFSVTKVIYFSPNGTADQALVQIGDGLRHYTLSIPTGTSQPKLIRGTVENVTTDTIDLDLQWLTGENILDGHLP